MVRRHWPIIGWVICFLLISVAILQTWNLARRVERNTGLITSHVADNRKLICSMSRLIAYVPAIQFEGESDQNFIGWVDARQRMLVFAREATCTDKTRAALAARVKRDEILIKRLER